MGHPATSSSGEMCQVLLTMKVFLAGIVRDYNQPFKRQQHFEIYSLFHKSSCYICTLFCTEKEKASIDKYTDFELKIKALPPTTMQCLTKVFACVHSQVELHKRRPCLHKNNVLPEHSVSEN